MTEPVVEAQEQIDQNLGRGRADRQAGDDGREAPAPLGELRLVGEPGARRAVIGFYVAQGGGDGRLRRPDLLGRKLALSRPTTCDLRFRRWAHTTRHFHRWRGRVAAGRGSSHPRPRLPFDP
jgi:hypothetical protein